MPTTPAGQRDRRVRFERATVTRSALGGKTPTAASWTPLCSRWAKVLWGTGAERRAAAAEGAVQTATFRVLADSVTREVTAEDRIVIDGFAFDIEGIAPIGRSEIEFTGTTKHG